MPAWPTLRRPRLRHGAGDAVLVVVVVAALVVAAGLLHHVASQASSINDHAKHIAMQTRGIKQGTDAVSMLEHTNVLAASILRSAQPLDEGLATTIDRAQAIDAKGASINRYAHSIHRSADGINGSARSIEGHAGTILDTSRAINTTAQDINVTAGNINTLAAAILDVAGRINTDVRRINLNLNSTIALARRIQNDTHALVGEGRFAHKESACIDREANQGAGAYNGGRYCYRDVNR